MLGEHNNSIETYTDLKVRAPMSLSSTETYLRNAKQQLSQADVNQSLIRAIGELMREIKNMEHELHRMKRNVQMSRRF